MTQILEQMIGAYVATADRRDDVIVVKTAYSESELIRAVPGSRYKSADHQWEIPLSWAGFLTLHGIMGDRLQIGNDLGLWAAKHSHEFIAPALALRESITVTEQTPSPYLSALRELDLYHRWDA